MKSLENKLKEFDRCMSEIELSLDEGIGFDDICHRIGVMPGAMNDVIVDQFGISGYEFVNHFRSIR